MTSKWERWPCLGFDLETTGVDMGEDRIVTAALVAIWDEGRKRHVTNYTVDPGIEVPEGAADIHGFTRQRAIAEQTHTVEQMLFEVTSRVALAMSHGIPVVGANIHYDLTLLEAENRRQEPPVDSLADRLGRGKVQPVVDVMVLDKKADRFRKGGRKLTDLCGHYGVQLDSAHDSGADALAACLLWPKIMSRHASTFRGMTMPALHQAQVGWRREQADGLRAYFDRNGTEHDGVCGEWPLHEACLRDRAGATS